MNRSYVIVLTHRELGDRPHLAVGVYTSRRQAEIMARDYACLTDVVEVIDVKPGKRDQ